MERKFKVMYWKYKKFGNVQVWYEYDNYKKALKKLNELGEKEHYTELWYGEKLCDYRN